MAISPKEKKLIAGGLIAASVGIVFLCVMPAWDAIVSSMASITAKDQEITQQSAALQTKKQELAEKQANQKLPEDINIRVFEPETFDKNVKIMLDTIISAVSQSNNTLISLEPTVKPGDTQGKETGTLSNPTPGTPAGLPGTSLTSTGSPGMPAAPATDPGMATQAPTNGGGSTDPNTGLPNIMGASTNSTGVMGDQIQFFAYTLAVRGTYDTLMDFVGDLSNNPELIEITSINMKNENGPERIKGKNSGSVDIVRIPGEEEEQEQETSAEKALIDPAKPIKLTIKMKLLLIPKPGMPATSMSPSSTDSSASSSMPSLPGTSTP